MEEGKAVSNSPSSLNRFHWPIYPSNFASAVFPQSVDELAYLLFPCYKGLTLTLFPPAVTSHYSQHFRLPILIYCSISMATYLGL